MFPVLKIQLSQWSLSFFFSTKEVGENIGVIGALSSEQKLKRKIEKDELGRRKCKSNTNQYKQSEVDTE